MQLPSIDLSLFFQALSVVLSGALGIWVAKKVIKLVNRS